MATQLDICNMAIRNLGVSSQIADLTNERSKEAQACRLFYPQVLDEVLRDAPWPFATRVTLLAQVAEEPTSEWLFSYRYPANCLTIRRILPESQLRVSMFNATEIRYPALFPRIDFRIARDDDGLLVYSQTDAPYAEWTERVEDPTQYPPDFTSALAWKLSFYIAPSVAGGDQFKLGDRALGIYVAQIARAKQNAGNESQGRLDEGQTSELENARL